MHVKERPRPKKQSKTVHSQADLQELSLRLLEVHRNVTAEAVQLLSELQERIELLHERKERATVFILPQRIM